MGKMGFNYSIIVCARAERDCPKTFPGVGTRLVWIFDDPRGEDVPEEEPWAATTSPRSSGGSGSTRLDARQRAATPSMHLGSEKSPGRAARGYAS